MAFRSRSWKDTGWSKPIVSLAMPFTKMYSDLLSVASSSQGIRLDPYMVCVGANCKVKAWPTILIKEHLQNFVS